MVVDGGYDAHKFSMISNSAILEIDYALPAAVLTNEQLATEFQGWTADKILAKTGIRERHIAAPDECASDLAVRAAEKLLARLNFQRDKIDYLIYCTQTPDYLLPTTACLIQDRLRLRKSSAALDFNLGCSGYIYGLGMAKALMDSGQAECVLLLNADTYTRLINPKDKSVRTLFGDAGTATLVTRGPGAASLTGPFVYGTDGKGGKNLMVPTRGLRQDYVANAELISDDAGNARTVNDLFMNGPEVFAFSLEVVPEIIARLLAQAGLGMNDIDLFVFHQANLFMLQHLQKKLRIPPERFCIAFEDVGNTVSCTIPIALRKAMDAGKLQAASRVALVGFGVGYSWGATILQWGAPTGDPVGAVQL
jgi:3-oxoacyl-[acyl-carrier-protein] synthase-3